MLIDASRADSTEPDAPPLAVVARPLGRQTNNFAEYTAVVLALERALELGAREVEVVLDSKLAVEQLMGRWRVREASLVPLHAKASELLRRFDRWTLRHEARASNAAADALANLALDDPAAAAAAEAQGSGASDSARRSRAALSWPDFAREAPQIAVPGERMLRAFTVGYLATLRPDGAPRVHPISLTLTLAGLFVFVIAGSRRAGDLAHDPRYALHSFPHSPAEDGWNDEEFEVEGLARRLTDPAEIELVRQQHTDDSGADDICYELRIARAHWKTRQDGRPRVRRWALG